MKRNFIKLIKEIKKDGTPVFDTYLTPTQIPFRKIYDAADFMDGASSEETSAQQNMDQMLDMVVNIYDNQFTKDDLLDGLHAPDAVEELREQISFIAQGNGRREKKGISETDLGGEPITWSDHKRNMRDFIRSMMKEGKDINELMEMPFSFFMELVEEEAEKKVTKTTSMIDAFM